MCEYKEEEEGVLNRHESLVFDVGIFVLIQKALRDPVKYTTCNFGGCVVCDV